MRSDRDCFFSISEIRIYKPSNKCSIDKVSKFSTEYRRSKISTQISTPSNTFCCQVLNTEMSIFSNCPSIRSSIRPSVCQSVCLYVCLCVRQGTSLGFNHTLDFFSKLMYPIDLAPLKA